MSFQGKLEGVLLMQQQMSLDFLVKDLMVT
jgi:hypothetical protein